MVSYLCATQYRAHVVCLAERPAMHRRKLTIATIASVPLQLHWSWLVGLFALTLFLSQLYANVTSEIERLALAFATALMLYLSIVLHEFGHAAAALLYRMPVRGLTLFAFGGRTEVDETNIRPTQELLIAAAGPFVSLLLALGWGAAWWLSEGPFQSLALALSMTNIGLLVLNLMPGYPLDGGRILKASLWFLFGAEIPAARTAMLIGRACGWVFLGIGIAHIMMTGDLFNGLAIALTGHFLARTASDGFQQLVLQRALDGVHVADLMQRAFRAVAPDLPLDQFVGHFVLGQADQGFPVVQRPDADAPQPLLGMMTLRNLKRFTLNQWTLTSVDEAMTPVSRVRSLSPDTAANVALRTLLESGEEQLPVMVGTTLQGVLRRRDLLHYIQRQLERN